MTSNTATATNKFFLEQGLYAKTPITALDTIDLFEILLRPKTLDTFCHECGQRSTFQPVLRTTPHVELYGKGIGRGVPIPIENAKMFEQHFEQLLKQYVNRAVSQYFSCSRVREHTTVFTYWYDGDCLQKIGQFPSVATLLQPEVRKYIKLLSPDKYKELNKAIGLHSHGVGIGSFVYLRRIFEDLIQEAYEQAKQHSDWNDQEFNKARMADKILMLRGFVPQLLIDLKDMYSVLSKGIHELEEQICLEIFPAVRAGIEVILDDKLAKLEQEKKEQTARLALAKWHSDLSK